MKNDFKELLKANGFKATPARLAILKVFSAGCKPFSAEDIFKSAKAIADQVTVYRTLSSFEEKGILKRVDLRKDAIYYELNSTHHHHHIICKQCGKIESFDKCSVKRLSKEMLASSKMFASIADHSLEFFGLCKACTKV